MKTTISIPDQVFTDAERLARRLKKSRSQLNTEAVANVSQIVTVDRTVFSERIGRLSRAQLDTIFAGLDIVLGRP